MTMGRIYWTHKVLLVIFVVWLGLLGCKCAHADPVMDYPEENMRVVNGCLVIIEANMAREVMDYEVLGIAFIGSTDDISVMYSIVLELTYRDLTENHRIVYCAENNATAIGTSPNLKELMSRLQDTYGMIL